MNRIAQLAVLAIIAVAVAFSLYWWLWRGETSQVAEAPVPGASASGERAPPPAAPAQSSEVTSSEVTSSEPTSSEPTSGLPTASGLTSGQSAPASQSNRSGASSDGAEMASQAPQVIARQTPEAPLEFLTPSFDVVRVEKSGEAVVAGRAEPRSEVTLYDNGKAIASTTADSKGEWVLVPEQPLAPGNHELGVTARGADGRSAQSSDVVIVFVPRPPAVAAADPPQPAAPPAEATAKSQTLAAVKPVAPERAPPPSPEGQAPNATAAPETQAPVVATPGTPAPQPQPASSAPAPADVVDTAKSNRGQVAVTTPESGADGPLVIIAPREGGPARVLQQPATSEEGIVAGQLALESIDYERDGRASVGGRAAPGNRVRIYLDNQLAGEAGSNPQGRWSATLDVAIEPGLHQLRVDELGRDGEVVARIEAPFSRAEVVADLPRDRTVIVQWGNSLWRIARRTYGDGMQYHTIFQANANQIRDPDLIYPGQVFSLPEKN
ncbi:MAG: Ig-like domain-containing protein [Kiloniellales bacterium]